MKPLFSIELSIPLSDREKGRQTNKQTISTQQQLDLILSTHSNYLQMQAGTNLSREALTRTCCQQYL